MKLVTNLDFSKLQALNMVIQPLGTAPSSPVTAQVYYDTTANAPRYWDGSAWTLKATDSVLHNGQTLAYVLSRANHTGTQTASTISDLAAVVQAYRLDQFAAPTADVSLNSHKITNLLDPTGSQDAATMGWVQTQVSNSAAGIDAKPSVRAASTGNLTLSGAQTIDGVSVIAGDRVLAKNQTTASTNGVYVAAAGAWTRAVDADASAEMTPGAFWYVEEGTVNGKTQWRLENVGTITLGTTSLTINQFGSAASYSGSTSILLTGSVFSVIVKASGGILSGASGLEIDTSIVARRYAVSIGNGSLTTITVTHNLGTQDVVVSVRDSSTNEIVLADVIAATSNTVTVGFATAPASNAYRVTVIG